MTKKSRQKLKYLQNKKSFSGKIKSIFHHFKGLSVAKNCLRSESAHLNKAPDPHYFRVFFYDTIFTEHLWKTNSKNKDFWSIQKSRKKKRWNSLKVTGWLNNALRLLWPAQNIFTSELLFVSKVKNPSKSNHKNKNFFVVKFTLLTFRMIKTVKFSTESYSGIPHLISMFY